MKYNPSLKLDRMRFFWCIKNIFCFYFYAHNIGSSNDKLFITNSPLKTYIGGKKIT